MEKKPFSWLSAWVGSKRITLSKSFQFIWPSAANDYCKVCSVSRKNHMGRSHEFYESDKRRLL